MGSAAQEAVARTVVTQPGRLRRASAAAVLALLGASALAPVVIEVTGGTAVAAALAGVAGNIGAGHLTGRIERLAGRLRHGKAADPDVVRDALAADLLDALERGDAAAQTLGADLTALLMKVDGVTAAVGAAGDDLRTHLIECFTELAQQQSLALRTLQDLSAEQRRQGQRLRRNTALHEETVDRLRRLTRHLEETGSADRAAPSDVPPPGALARPLVVPIDPAVVSGEWRGGVEVAVGDRVYLLHDDDLSERPTADRSVLHREARAVRLVPAGRSGGVPVWLRQVEDRRNTPAGRSAVRALAGEHDLLRTLGRTRGLPRIDHFAATGRAATLVLSWPMSRSAERPCETLDGYLGGGGVPLDPWRVFRLCTGLAGLCGTLAELHRSGVAHRCLTPAGIIMLDDGRLVLRDLGLAARGHEPGEGPADYQAPEQRRRGAGRPRASMPSAGTPGMGTPNAGKPGGGPGATWTGPWTDVYQVAAVAYHLVTGRPPDARIPLPVHAQAPDVPERVGRALDAALAADPAGRPDVSSLGAALRAIRDTLA